METAVTVNSVSVRNLPTGKPVYDVVCGDGLTRQVWEAALANAINGFANTNQPVQIRWSSKDKPQNDGSVRTYHTIHAFAPPGQALPPYTPRTGGTSGGGGGGFQQSQQGFTPEVVQRITILSAQENAVVAVGSLYEGAGPEAYEQMKAHVLDLAQTFYKIARAHEAAPVTQEFQTGTTGQILPSPGQPVTPQDVAQGIPGVNVGVFPQPVPESASNQASDNIDWT